MVVVPGVAQVQEETGYSVAASRLHHLVTCPAGVGTGGSSMALYWLEVRLDKGANCASWWQAG